MLREVSATNPSIHLLAVTTNGKDMNQYGADTDDVFLVMLRPEEEHEKTLAAAKAALTAERWAAIGGKLLSERAQKMLRAATIAEMAEERKGAWS
ncbi:MAG: hypothetical protein FWC42_00560 [Proteobacteria bacterium]|nr:hypothetical protein [Pseudomonadota bacterium]